MTVATVAKPFTFTVPVNPAAELIGRFGYRLDTLRGRRHYVTRNERNRAVVGPVRHRGLGLWARVVRMFTRKAKPAPEPTMGDVAAHVADQMAGVAQALKDMPTMKLFTFGPPSPTPPQKPRRKTAREFLATVRWWFTDRWYNEDWHAGAQRTAKTLVYWAFLVFSVVVFVKGAAWVVTL